MIQPSNLLPNCAEGSLAKKDTFLGQVGLHGPDFESDTFGEHVTGADIALNHNVR